MVASSTPRTGPNPSVLVYRDAYWAKAAALLALASCIAYLVDRPRGPPNGGTWLGYTLGTVAGLLIVWLAWFGVRKRRYGQSALPLRAWLSAHIYLGVSALVVATLHTGFRFELGVHTLAFVLMALVVASGILGIVAFARVPIALAGMRTGATVESTIREIVTLNADIRQRALRLDDRSAELVAAATEEMPRRLGPRQLVFGINGRNVLPPATLAVIGQARERLVGEQAALSDEVTPVVQLLARRATLVDQCRRDLRLRTLLRIWRLFHVPLTIALIGALAIHIFVVFFY